jgi:hypothetical protein
MRSHFLFSKPFFELMRYALGQPPRVDEYQRGPMLFDEVDEPLINFRPRLVRHHSFQRRTRQFNGDIHRAQMARINDLAPRRSAFVQPFASDQEPGNFFNRFLRRRKADPLNWLIYERPQPFHAERQMRTAPVADERMDFVHNQRSHRAQYLPARRRREQQIKRLRCRDEYVRRLFGDRLALCRRRIAGPNRSPDGDVFSLADTQRLANSRQRFLQVFVDVVAQRLER